MQPHGTIARARQHRVEGERPKDCCPECHAAELQYQKDYRRGITKRKVCTGCGGGVNGTEHDQCKGCRRRQRDRPRCGTKAGYKYHVNKLKEVPCDKCLEHMEMFKAQGTVKSPCVNPGCTRSSMTTDEYCLRCRHGAIVGWRMVKGVRKPIYHIEGSYGNVAQETKETV